MPHLDPRVIPALQAATPEQLDLMARCLARGYEIVAADEDGDPYPDGDDLNWVDEMIDALSGWVEPLDA